MQKKKLFAAFAVLVLCCMAVSPAAALKDSFRIIDAGTNDGMVWITVDNSHSHPIWLDLQLKAGRHVVQHGRVWVPRDSRQTVFIDWNGQEFNKLKLSGYGLIRTYYI